jgi:RHS repeat-associated protein
VHGPGLDEPLVWYEGAGTASRRWLHADERGSVIAVVGSSGGALAINSYDAWGIPAASNMGRFQYTGQTWIPEIGLYYYKARVYSPTLGRFLSADPIGYGDGMNMYAYVGNDPVNRVDPLGLTQDVDLPTTDAVIPEPIIVTGTKPPPIDVCTGVCSQFIYDRLTMVDMPDVSQAMNELRERRETEQPQKPQCPLAKPTGNYRVGANADPRFAPELSSILSQTLAELNAKGITPYITSGFRTSGDQARMRGGASGSNPAARVSNHQLGLSIDLNTRTADSRQ